MTGPIYDKTATEMLFDLSQGEFSSRGLVEISLGLIAKVNPHIKAVWTCCAFAESVFEFTRPALRTEMG